MAKGLVPVIGVILLNHLPPIDNGQQWVHSLFYTNQYNQNNNKTKYEAIQLTNIHSGL